MPRRIFHPDMLNGGVVIRKILNGLLTLLLFSMLGFVMPSAAEAKNAKEAHMKKILFVVTSHDQLGNTGRKTGFYLPEVVHPYMVLSEKGFTIDIASPNGGKAPVDGIDQADDVSKAFLADKKYSKQIEETLKLDQLNAADYAAIFLAGGHGTMWDFPDNARLADLIKSIYESGGVVAAVCHGPSGLVNVKLSNGKYLVAGKKVSAFTNEEETETKLSNVVPFLLESKLEERGANFNKAKNWQPIVVVDGRLITGQNPASAKAVGIEMVRFLTK